jgi:hypothetical protein
MHLFALKELNAAQAAKLSELVKQAVSSGLIVPI